jgi:hypothetical protein
MSEREAVTRKTRSSLGVQPRRKFLRASVGGLAAWLHSGSLGAALAPRTRAAEKADSRVELESSDASLTDGFRWAKNQALSYAYSGDPVGPWYEAALPGRQAFCMRDTSHQATGAQILGLAASNENMLRKFAENISASRDWCSYWEINKNNRPAPVDYVNDQDFWYNLPANFDVLDACYRQFRWTGNPAYLDPVFLNFYKRTVTDYVKKWDINGDGLLEHLPRYGHRGIASYDERHIAETMVGGDLIAAQYAAYRDYAAIETLVHHQAEARRFLSKAEQLRSIYNNEWWSSDRGTFHGFLGNDGKFSPAPSASFVDHVLFPLYCQMIEEGHKTEAALALLIRQLPATDNQLGGVEANSYVPEILYSYGRSDAAYRSLLHLMDPSLERREYPEVSFAVVGACATGLMGIAADFPAGTVATFPQLSGVARAELEHVPVFDNQISVGHFGSEETRFTNESGPAIRWRASLPGQFRGLLVDGRPTPATSGTRLGGAAETWLLVDVRPGATRTVRQFS